jgi:agmatine deiminase
LPEVEVTRRLPGEWELHDSTVVAWPSREEVWGGFRGLAEDEYAALIAAIAEDERVLVVCREADEAHVRHLTSHPNVGIMTHAIDDGWIRDNGPFLVRDDDTSSGFVAVAFGFNSWGNRFSPTRGDLTVRRALAEELGVAFEDATGDAVLEGGAISANGAGSFLISAECALTPSRNPNLSRTDFEATLARRLGADEAIWVPFGLLEDLQNTDGHVDNVAVFVDEETVVVQTCDESNPNFRRLAQNAEVLRAASIGDGRSLRVVECHALSYGKQPDGREQAMPYINFVLTNQAVILPSAGNETTDDEAAVLFEELFPTRRAKFVRAACMAYGGGGPHCVTIQIPALPLAR